jgi:hypothetical protein
MMKTNDFLELAFGESAKGVILVFVPARDVQIEKGKKKWTWVNIF